MRKILLITTKYPTGEGEAWLTNELAECFASNGDEVAVVVLSWEYSDGASGCISLNGVDIHRVRLWKFLYSKSFIMPILKIFLFSLLARVKCRGVMNKADIIVATTPCIAVWALVDSLGFKSNARKFLILWDFFPFYMKGLWGQGRNILFNFLYKWENRLYNKFDVIGCMTDESIKFLRDKYTLPSPTVIKLPLWAKQVDRVKLTDAEKLNIRIRYNISTDAFVSVYGGAMTKIQGLDNIIDLAAKLHSSSQFQFVLVGRGPELARLKNRVLTESVPNVVFVDYVPRDEYELLIASCDVGLVSLSGKHEVPSFPSKSIDYLKVGLPILASIDKTTEFGEILCNEMKAGLWAESGDNEAMANILNLLFSDPEYLKELSENGRKYFEDQMNVINAVNDIVNACEVI